MAINYDKGAQRSPLSIVSSEGMSQGKRERAPSAGQLPRGHGLEAGGLKEDAARMVIKQDGDGLD